jgi:hypothetical protein
MRRLPAIVSVVSGLVLGSADRPVVGAQDGHEKFVVPLTLPAESMPQASYVNESALLVDPLGARIEVVDAKAHPVQTAGAQRVVDDQLGDLGSVAPTEYLRSREPDSVVG